jgi:hypothetical protein
MILYIVFLLSVGFALACALAGFHIPELELISDPMTQKISLLIAILLFVWILIWLPFKRHEVHEKEHTIDGRRADGNSYWNDQRLAFNLSETDMREQTLQASGLPC